MNILKPFNAVPIILRPVLAYLLATPVFWLADILLGFEVRIAFLEDGLWKTAYYSVLTASAIACYLYPAWTAVFAFLESTANIFIHILSFIVPVFYLPAQVLKGTEGTLHFESGNLLGFIMVGTILVLSFQGAVDSMRNQ
jgi:hypothetical protein